MSVRQISSIWVSNLFLFVGWGFVLPLLPVYFSSQGLSSMVVGSLFSAGALASSLSTPYAGRLSDIHGRQLIFAASTFSVGLVVVLYSIARGVSELLLLTVLFTMTVMCSQVVIAASSLDHSTSMNYGKVFGNFRISGSIGWMVGTAFGGIMASFLGLDSIFYAACCSMIISGLLAFFSGGARTSPQKGDQDMFSPRKLLTNRGIQIIFVILSLSFMAQAAFSYFLPIYLEQRFDAPSWLIGLNFSIMSAAEVPAMMLLGAASDKVGRKSILALCLAFYPIRLLLTGFVPNDIMVTTVQVLDGLTFGGVFVVAAAYICDITSENARGASLGVLPVSQNVGTILGAYLVGVLISSYGFSEMFIAMAIFSTIPVFVLLMFRTHDKLGT